MLMYPTNLNDARPLRSPDALLGANLLDSVAYSSSTTMASYDRDLDISNSSQTDPSAWLLSAAITMSTTTNTTSTTAKSTMTSLPSTVTYNGMIGYNATDPLAIFTESCNGTCSFDLPIEIQILMCLLYGSLALTAIASNMIVCYIVLSNQRMRTATNYFIVNLAVGDILMALLCIPFTFPANLIFQYWPFGLSLCVIVSYSQANSVFISAYTMVAISIDKYLAIMYPMRLRMPKIQAKIIILVIWSLALITSLPTALLSSLAPASLDGMPTTSTVTASASSPILLPESTTTATRLTINSTGSIVSNPPAFNLDISPPAFNDLKSERAKSTAPAISTTIPPSTSSSSSSSSASASSSPPTTVPASPSSSATTQQRQEQSKYFCQESWTFWPKGKYYYSMALMILQFVLPLFVLVITYSRIVIVVWGKRMPGEEDNARDARMARSKRKMIKMVIFCVIAFALTWLPFNALIVIGDMHPDIWERQDIMYIWFTTHYLAMCHTTTNPLIYIWMNNRFRAGFKQVLANMCAASKRLLLLLTCYCCCLGCLLSCSRAKYQRVASKMEREPAEKQRRQQLTTTGSPNYNNQTTSQQLALASSSGLAHQQSAGLQSFERPVEAEVAAADKVAQIGGLGPAAAAAAAAKRRKRRQSHVISIQMTTVEYHGKPSSRDSKLARRPPQTERRRAPASATAARSRHKSARREGRARAGCPERQRRPASREGAFVVDTRQSSQSTASLSLNTNTTSLGVSLLESSRGRGARRPSALSVRSVEELRLAGGRPRGRVARRTRRPLGCTRSDEALPAAGRLSRSLAEEEAFSSPAGWRRAEQPETDEDVAGEVFHLNSSQSAGNPNGRPNGSLELLSDQFDGHILEENVFESDQEQDELEQDEQAGEAGEEEEEDEYEDEEDEELSPLRVGADIEMRPVGRAHLLRRDRLRLLRRLFSGERQPAAQPAAPGRPGEPCHLFEAQGARGKSLRRAILIHNHLLSSLDKLPVQRSFCDQAAKRRPNHEPVKREWHGSAGDSEAQGGRRLAAAGNANAANQSSSAPAIRMTNSFTRLHAGKSNGSLGRLEPPGAAMSPWLSPEAGRSPPSEAEEPAPERPLLAGARLLVRKSPTVYLINKAAGGPSELASQPDGQPNGVAARLL